MKLITAFSLLHSKKLHNRSEWKNESPLLGTATTSQNESPITIAKGTQTQTQIQEIQLLS